MPILQAFRGPYPPVSPQTNKALFLHSGTIKKNFIRTGITQIPHIVPRIQPKRGAQPAEAHLHVREKFPSIHVPRGYPVDGKQT